MARLYKNWTIHNILAHPLMQIMSLVGLNSLAGKIHDVTVPDIEAVGNG